MKKLEVEITLKSGRIINHKSDNYHTSQLKEWLEENLINEVGNIYGFIVFGDIVVNSDEIETIDLVK